MAVAGQWFPGQSLRHPLGGGHGHGHGGRRVRPGAAAARRGGIGLAHRQPAAGGGRRGARGRRLATVRDRWRGSGGMGTCSPGLGIVARSRQCWLIALRGPWHLRAAARLCGPVGRAVPRHGAWAAAHHGRERDVDAVRGLGRRRAAVRLAVGSHRPPQDAAVGRPRPPVIAHGAARSTCRACPSQRSPGCASWLAFWAPRRSCALRWRRENHPATAERHGDRLRQHHGDGGGRPVPAARRLPARPRLDRARSRSGRASTTSAPIVWRWPRCSSPAFAGLLCLLLCARHSAGHKPDGGRHPSVSRYGTFTAFNRCAQGQSSDSLQGMPADMSRVVLVSNRVIDLRKAPQAGGVAVALADVVRSRSALWFGWNGEIRATASPTLVEREGRLATVTHVGSRPPRLLPRLRQLGALARLSQPARPCRSSRRASSSATSTSTGGLRPRCSRCCAPTTSSGCTTIT